MTLARKGCTLLFYAQCLFFALDGIVMMRQEHLPAWLSPPAKDPVFEMSANAGAIAYIYQFALGSYLFWLYVAFIMMVDPLSPWTILIAMPSLFMGTMLSVKFDEWGQHTADIQGGATFAIRVNSVVFLSHLFRICVGHFVVKQAAHAKTQ